MKKPYRLAPHEKRTIVGGWDKPVWVRRAQVFLVPHFCWLYAEKDGGPVLVGQTKWAKWNGVQWHVGTWQVWLQFRRWRSEE